MPTENDILESKEKADRLSKLKLCIASENLSDEEINALSEQIHAYMEYPDIFKDELVASSNEIDILINNAGVYNIPLKKLVHRMAM